jgi:hypothetical protein
MGSVLGIRVNQSLKSCGTSNLADRRPLGTSIREVQQATPREKSRSRCRVVRRSQVGQQMKRRGIHYSGNVGHIVMSEHAL